jgi:Fe-Mn family superoxide dismutase
MTKPFEEKKFEIGALKGISAKTIEEHLKLYAGYVKNANELLAGATVTSGQYDRRFPFEFNGMRNHEIYFGSLEGGPQGDASVLAGFDLEKFKALALTRGVGWAMLYYDTLSQQLIQSWVDEQHLGQLSQCIPVLALDMWEHSYVADYQPSGKKQYVEDFFANLNWKNVEENFVNAQG